MFLVVPLIIKRGKLLVGYLGHNVSGIPFTSLGNLQGLSILTYTYTNYQGKNMHVIANLCNNSNFKFVIEEYIYNIR
jgi:hypothetical protein